MDFLDKNKLILGTVQFGQAYGATNFTKKLKKKNIFKILSLAWESNIRSFDTAPSYKTESIIGEFIKSHGIQNEIKIITKVPRIPNNGNWECCTRVSIEKSIKFLKTNINTLFFHHPGDIHRVLNDEKILAKIKSDYNIKKIGFSIYTVNEKKLFSNFSFKPAAQYPLSIANLSFQRCNFGKGNNFIRSIFLQGLLLNKKFNKKKILSQRLVNSLKNFHSLLDFKKIDSLKLTLSYIAKLKNIDQILFGVDNITQLEKIINCELYNKIDYNLIKKINKLFYLNDTDPRNW